jgi:alkylhydroperoxidase/carboxymuconolactone decarboxylase family protein YurZ
MNKKIVQTAGREQLGDFAPMFAHLNDDVLFGEVWNEEALNNKNKMYNNGSFAYGKRITDSSLKYHLINAKNNGVTKEEIAAIINTLYHVMRLAQRSGRYSVLQKRYVVEENEALTEKDRFQNEINVSRLESRIHTVSTL